MADEDTARDEDGAADDETVEDEGEGEEEKADDDIDADEETAEDDGGPDEDGCADDKAAAADDDDNTTGLSTSTCRPWDTNRLPLASTATSTGLAIPRPETTCFCVPSALKTTTRLLPVSATYTWPAASTAMPRGVDRGSLKLVVGVKNAFRLRSGFRTTTRKESMT